MDGTLFGAFRIIAVSMQESVERNSKNKQNVFAGPTDV
jgi:hypothetical protein